jgi:hypothetical protein
MEEGNNNNGNGKLVKWQVFVWVITLITSAIVGLSGWVYNEISFLKAKASAIDDDATEMKVMMSEMKTNIEWIKTNLNDLKNNPMLLQKTVDKK